MRVIKTRIDENETKVEVKGEFVTTDSYGFEAELEKLIEKYRI